MNVRRTLSLICVAVFTLASGIVAADAAMRGGDGVSIGAPRARDPRVPPRKRKNLARWLRTQAYRSEYVAEPAVHDSRGPHGGNVRTYFNSILAEDICAGRTTWSKGAAMVKELYLSGTTEVRGYAVMIKAADETGALGDGWVFYEAFDVTGDNAAYGRGLGLCVNCHRAGTDLLLSTFPRDSVCPTE